MDTTSTITCARWKAAWLAGGAEVLGRPGTSPRPARVRAPEHLADENHRVNLRKSGQVIIPEKEYRWLAFCRASAIMENLAE